VKYGKIVGDRTKHSCGCGKVARKWENIYLYLLFGLIELPRSTEIQIVVIFFFCPVGGSFQKASQSLIRNADSTV